MALDAFGAPHLGDEGAAESGIVHFRRSVQPRRVLSLAQGLTARVPLVYAMPEDDGRLLRAAADGADGVVVAGVGSGNLPPRLQAAAFELHDAGLPVVLATRCVEGEVTPIYGFDGGSAVSVRRGLIPAGPRTAQLARLELAIACSAGAAYGD
jgi:L-asparaginase